MKPPRSNPNGVAARRPENQSPAFPAGHNPVGVDGPSMLLLPRIMPVYETVA
jgi:hypothetical protein